MQYLHQTTTSLIDSRNLREANNHVLDTAFICCGVLFTGTFPNCTPSLALSVGKEEEG